MSAADEVAIARDELRQARQRVRCDSAESDATTDGCACWSALALVVMFNVGVVFLALVGDGPHTGPLIAMAVGAVLIGWCCAWHWWRAGVRAGINHERERP